MGLECPIVPVSMKHYVENKINGYEEYTGWRDEDGCGKVTVGKSSTRIANIGDAEYVVFVLKRLTVVQNNMEIIKTEPSVDVNDRINLIDFNGRTAQFEPISIIHHIGHVIGNRTQGHYLADVKNKITNSWFRTSDNAPPEDITEIGLTKMGYIILYKKTSLKDEKLSYLIFPKGQMLVASPHNPQFPLTHEFPFCPRKYFCLPANCCKYLFDLKLYLIIIS